MRHALGAMLSIIWMAGMFVWVVLLVHTMLSRNEPRRSAMTLGEKLLFTVSVILLGALTGVVILTRSS